jgi:hypothetical protein
MTIEYRAFSNTKYTDFQQINIIKDPVLNEIVEESLSQFKDKNIVTTRSNDQFESAMLAGTYSDENLKKLMAIQFPIKGDYFLQLEFINTSTASVEIMHTNNTL